MGQQIQGSKQDIEIDVTGAGTAWEVLVCLASSSVNTSADTSSDNTNCGVLTSISDASMTVDFDAVCEVTPTATQVSYKDLLTAMVAKTMVKVRVQSPVVGSTAIGVAYFHEFSAYINSLTLTQANAEFIKFSGSFTSTGTLDITV
jgi:hypothetical protein